MSEFNFISSKLIDWYLTNKRELPWRNISDPYRIWISEIILQQTRVVQGLEYFNRFIERFPDVQTLAAADEQEVLKLWQGLGYYSRARNLHTAAKTIAQEYGGEFPQDYKAILNLKGIGEYTAAAITSFAWNMPYPVVDGNVFRFLSRLFAIDTPIDTGKGKKYFTELAEEIMDPERAGLFNQAIMEFGALQCVPSSPDCGICPFQAECLALEQQQIAFYPVKQNKTQTQELYLYYFHIHDDTYLYLKKREGKGIWENLFEFPMIESNVPLDFKELSGIEAFKKWFPDDWIYNFKVVIENKKHILSHRILYATFYEVTGLQVKPAMTSLSNDLLGHSDLIKVKQTDKETYPVHRLMEYYWEKLA